MHFRCVQVISRMNLWLQELPQITDTKMLEHIYNDPVGHF